MVKNTTDPQTNEAPSLAERQRIFGAKLKSKREAHRLTVQAAAQSTRISHAFIEAMEAGTFEKLPAQVFGRGFVRNLCKLAQVDPEETKELLKEYDACWPKGPAVSVLKIEIKNKPFPEPSEVWTKAARLLRKAASREVLVKVALPLAVMVAVALVALSTPMWKPWLAKLKQRSSHAAASLSEKAPANDNTPAKVIEISPRAHDESDPGAVDAPSGSDSSDSYHGGGDEAASPVTTTPAGSSSTPTSAPVAANAPEASKSSASHGAASSQGAIHVGVQPGTQVAALKPEQVLELMVSDAVRVRMDIDGEAVTKELTPDTYKIPFSDKADLLVFDAAAVKINFNGKALGTLGAKGRVRRLSFQAHTPEPKNP